MLKHIDENLYGWYCSLRTNEGIFVGMKYEGNNKNATGPNEEKETVGGSLHVGRLAEPNKGYG